MNLPRPGFRPARAYSHVARTLPAVLLALVAGCATAGGARTSLSIHEARNHALAALQQYGYTVVNDGGRVSDATGEPPARLNVTGERQQQTGMQYERQATIVMRITLRRSGTGPEGGTEVSVSPSVRYQSASRGGGGDTERRQLDAMARHEAEQLQKVLLSATSLGFD